MTQKDNILQELRDLHSSLVNAASQNIYQVPAGYFDGLAEQVLRRIKALEAVNAAEELNHLSPLLNSISKKMPYSVPSNFFDGLAESITGSVINEHQTPAEELETLSPLLSGLKKEMPYSVPMGYFETINTTTVIQPPAKVISITKQSWFRYAAAAVVTGFIIMAGFLVFNKQGNIDPKEKSFAWVEKSLNKVSTDDIDKFVELADEEAPVIASADASNEIKDKNEIKELIKDVSDKDLQDFLDETRSDETDSNDDVLMN
jgi:hypothetical protein